MEWNEKVSIGNAWNQTKYSMKSRARKTLY